MARASREYSSADKVIIVVCVVLLFVVVLFGGRAPAQSTPPKVGEIVYFWETEKGAPQAAIISVVGADRKVTLTVFGAGGPVVKTTVAYSDGKARAGRWSRMYDYRD